MSEEQQVSEAPERIWIDGDEVARAIRNRVGSYYTHPSPDDASNRDIEYVRADSSPVAQPPKQDDADILDDERVDKELRRWQDGIRDKLISLGAPDWKIDGAGCDSGDPLDFTLAEVGQGVGYFIDQLDELRAETLKGICVYCGAVQQYESLEQKSGAEGNRIRVEHIKKCTQRPELKLIAYCEALQDACQQFVHWYAEDSTEAKRDNAYDAAVAALALPTALTKPQPSTPPSAEVVRETGPSWNAVETAEHLASPAIGKIKIPAWRAMVNEIAAAIDNAALRGSERQWLPIETAPKDGREVLLVVERRAGIRHGMLVGHYMPGGHCIEDHPPIDEGWYFWSGSMFDKASKPIKWMPLPDPDSLNQTKEE